MIKEIAQKYENVQKGVGDMMSGALIETNARRLKSEAENETKKKLHLGCYKMGNYQLIRLQNILVLELKMWRSLQDFKQCD